MQHVGGTVELARSHHEVVIALLGRADLGAGECGRLERVAEVTHELKEVECLVNVCDESLPDVSDLATSHFWLYVEPGR